MKYTVKELFEYGQKELPLDFFPERDEELLRILLDLLAIPRYEYSLHLNDRIDKNNTLRFKEIITERKSGQPLAYILGYTYFYQDKFPVSRQTLIPRYDTENLVEEVKKSYAHSNVFSILDIGTGTGAIALSLARIFPQALIKGIDIFDQAFKNSQQQLGLITKNISVECIDFLEEQGWESLGSWDCIVSNPPYLDDDDMDALDPMVKNFEPHTALYAEKNGMIFYEAIAKFSKEHLNSEGMIFLEIDHKHQKVSDLFSQEEYPMRYLVNDLSGLPRILVLKKILFA